ncbi:hypothetical protein [Staphylococcus edaphicus]|uniref:hypothetical protein n=1 Tax=Staphylococcus edaphicus TaxID=1955013 RepID=UPI00137AB40B|nr:hypothetical protein [Staphylococcus edaphicus]
MLDGQLLTITLTKYKHVLQTVLLTDNTDKTRRFYEKHGLVTNDKYQTLAYTLFRQTL